MFIRTPSPNLQIVRAKSFLIEAGDPSDADLIQKVLRVVLFVAASKIKRVSPRSIVIRHPLWGSMD